MSSKIVRKQLLLAQESEKSLDRPAKRPRPTSDDSTPIVSRQDLLRHHAESLLRFDRSTTDVKVAKSKSFKLSDSQLLQGGVGNSRSSAGHARSERHEPTFDKRRHQKEKKHKTLKQIAKALRQHGKKK